MSPRMIPEGRVLLIPKMSDLSNAVDITDYVTIDGLQVESEYDSAIEALQASYHMEITGDDIRKIAEAMSALVDQKAKRVERAMNTTMSYPTSTPPWSRRKR